jgi:hypothetical protein
MTWTAGTINTHKIIRKIILQNIWAKNKTDKKLSKKIWAKNNTDKQNGAKNMGEK